MLSEEMIFGADVLCTSSPLGQITPTASKLLIWSWFGRIRTNRSNVLCRNDRMLSCYPMWNVLSEEMIESWRSNIHIDQQRF